MRVINLVTSSKKHHRLDATTLVPLELWGGKVNKNCYITYAMPFGLFLVTPSASASCHILISKQQHDQGTRVQ